MLGQGQLLTRYMSLDVSGVWELLIEKMFGMILCVTLMPF